MDEVIEVIVHMDGEDVTKAVFMLIAIMWVCCCSIFFFRKKGRDE